jgi:spermidine synthase
VTRALLPLFFLSGTAALIYELVWFHLVTLIVGASSLSIAALLASFMGGMALGSALLPRLVSPSRHPLRVVAALELGIGAIGLAMPFVLPYVQHGYVAIIGYGYSGVLLRAAVCGLVLLPPTMLMGATLPAISRWTGVARDGASAVSLLYMANIGGGAFGTVLAGFYLLRVHDTIIATLVAVTLNLIVALTAWLMASVRSAPAGALATPETGAFPPSAFAKATADKPDSRPVLSDTGRQAGGVEGLPAPEPSAFPTPDSRLPTPDSRLPTPVLIVTALSGLTALGAQVVWTRQLSLLFGASVYTFSLILAVFLTGLGLGSAIGASLARRSRQPAIALAFTQVLLVMAIAFASRAIVELLPVWQPTTSFLPDVRSSPGLTFAFDAARCAVAILPATLLWGASFPLALAAVRGEGDPGRPVARVNAINTMGSLTGAIAFTLIGIPVLGSQHAQQALVMIAAVAGAWLLWTSGAGRSRWAAASAMVLAGVCALVIVPEVPGRLIAYGRSVNSWSTIKRFFYLAEGATASVAVTEGVAGARQFHIAGKVEASDMDVDMRLERMLGHVPALVHPDPRTILVVGVGAGVTAGTFVVHPGVERIVVCEIEPKVPASARAYFGEENHHVFDDPRVELIFDDARHFLQTTTEKFDIITSDPIHPWVRGAATLYSLEYLELVKQHLEPGGVVTQWVPMYETDERSVKSEIATLARVFPDTTLWNPDLLEEGYDLVAMGRVDGGPISEAAIADRLLRAPAVERSLRQVAIESAASLLATYAGRGRDLAPWLANAEINRERHLRLQYMAGLAYNSDQRYAIFQAILQHRSYPFDLFVASAETEARLRRWYVPSY